MDEENTFILYYLGHDEPQHGHCINKYGSIILALHLFSYMSWKHDISSTSLLIYVMDT
jgi:hypothetical protein